MKTLDLNAYWTCLQCVFKANQSNYLAFNNMSNSIVTSGNF